MFDRQLTREEKSVRGNLVFGFSKADMDLLDVFEADEYTRDKVYVHPLAAPLPLNEPSESVTSSSAPPLPPIAELAPAVQTEAYVWAGSISFLIPELWSYEVFIRDNAWKWVGTSASLEEYEEVDRRREMNGVIQRAAEKAVESGAVN